MRTTNLSQDGYKFSVEPRIVKPRSKFRDPPLEEQQPLTETPANIMWHKGVIRGNTYASSVSTSRDAAKQFITSKKSTGRKPGRTIEIGEYEAVQADVSTPRPVEGRRHTEIQTDENIEILTDKPPDFEKDTQTDFYIDRPVNRLFVPYKAGEDRETQIWEGELFDFDYEVEPILQVLMGRALEQGRMEVLEEEELKILKDEQKRYDEVRYAELTEAQKMEAEEKRRLDEGDRRKKQHRLKNTQGVSSHKKLVSRIMAKDYLQNVHRNAMAMLSEQGTFRNDSDFEIAHSVLPWMFDDVVEQQECRRAIARTLKTYSNVISMRLAEFHENSILKEQEKKRKAEEDKQRLEDEKVQRRQQRAEARRKRDEEEKLRQLQEKIAAVLIAKGETKPGVFSQVLGDMDSTGREGNTVGLLGGIIGELALVFSTLDDLRSAKVEDPLNEALAAVEITSELIQRVVDYVIDDMIKDGKIEITVTEDIEAQLTAIDPDLNLANLHTKPDQAAEIREILRASINSFVLRILRENSERTGLNGELTAVIVDSVINHILSPDDKARKVRLAKAPQSYEQDTRMSAVVVLMPNIEDTALFNLAEAKKVKAGPTKRGRRKSSKKESLNNLDDVRKESEEEKVISPVEVDLEDAVHVFPPQNDEMRVLIHQRAAAILFRREVLLYISTQLKQIDMKEIEILKRVDSRAKGVEEIVAGKVNSGLPVITYDKN